MSFGVNIFLKKKTITNAQASDNWNQEVHRQKLLHVAYTCMESYHQGLDWWEKV